MIPTLPRITLARGKARPLWAGHPWVYSGAIQSAEAAPPGSLVDVFDDGGAHVGVGTWHGGARIAVRMLGRELPDGGLQALIRERVATARRLRARFGLPSEATTAYRLLNGEGDGLPGVLCDVLGDLAAVQVTTVAAESWIPDVLDAVGLPRAHVSVPDDAARMEGLDPGDRLGRGDLEEHAVFRENGITWTLKPGRGQKTGFYADQRENRRAVGPLAAGGTMLDAFCYTGGFGLNAARAGAREVVGVDSSGPAVSVAAGTAKANGIDCATFHKEDVMRFLRGLGERTFDVVVLDPPKLARSRDALDDAYLKYRAFNVEGLRHVSPGGFLVSCSCSGLVSEELFLRMLTDAAHLAERRLTVHWTAGAGPDHPIPAAFPEGRYLKVVVASVGAP